MLPLFAGVATAMALGYLFWSVRPRPWQIANVVAFLANVAAVRSIPRLDSSNAMLQPLNYLTPASYAFAIWGVIYFLEYGFVCLQLLPRAQTELLRRVSPWWCGANACQVLWCLLFRPQFDSPGLLWLSAVALSSIAACLNRAHALIAAPQPDAQDGSVVLRVPVTLHFGWTTAAALVNWNGYVARCTSAPTPKLAVALLSAALATSVGSSVTVDRGSGLYGGTVAWAILAVGVQTVRSERLGEELGRGIAIAVGIAEIMLAAGLFLVAFGISYARNRVYKPGVGRSAASPSGGLRA
uniref:Uncharacterized protein n=1 Tax=Alexandrium catenella TaxID=2925 RepID=A0A7S1RET6_ALECA|mmetsp:Transcript_54687/g.146396  ORF Transcript_54687/g.146396 Transcript_54687/m.146396 type:complete len:297 (+) Transcript_54687:110-1000(+)